ncbi:MAG: hypothetical protein CJBNEKGG_02367 [Prosthecobacter sp.]|nr:hypothetical protein [Prosthecobacter sp.]
MRPVLLFIAASSAFAAEGLYFNGPEVVKLDWNTSCPRAADFNGDGLMDLVVINQDRARLEFLLQRKEGLRPGDPERTSRPDRWSPVLEMSRFDKLPLVIGHNATTLAVGDWNGDRRSDIAYVTDEKKLILRTQSARPGDWSSKKEFVLDSISEDTESLVCSDLDGDGRGDLALLTSTRLMILRQGQEGWKEPNTYVLGQADCGGLRAADLNGDGRTDLFYTAPDAQALLVRLQLKDASFAQEWRLEMEAGRCWAHAVRLGAAGGSGVATINDGTGMIEVARLTDDEVKPNADRASSIRYAMPAGDAKGGAVAFGDLNGDGDGDVVLTEAKNARLWFFAGNKDGSFQEGREFPALSGIEALAVADVNGDSKNELVVLSPSEKSVATAHWQKDRLTYPEVIHQSTDALLALTTGSIAGDPGTSVLVLSESKGRTSLLTLRWAAAEKKYMSSVQELPGSPGKPGALRVIDANQDGRGDLALFFTLAPMQILVSQTDAKLPFKRAEGLPDSLLNKVQPVALAMADVDGDDKAEVIVARDQLARAFRVGQDGRAVTVEQFNAPDSTAQLSAVLVRKDKAGKKQVLLADSARHKLHEMVPGADGVFRAAHTHALSSLAAEQMHLLGERLLVVGKTSFELNPLSGTALRLETILSFDSELKDTSPSDLIPAAFSGPGADDLALVDSTASRVIEFFQPALEKTPPAWRSGMYFRVFETDPHFRGKSGRENEPHDYLALDLNADGRLDLALLVHDRLLIYLRK